MKQVFSSLEGFENFLAQHGFTVEDGKYYFTADTNHNSYLTFEHFADGTAGGLKFTDSTGTKRDIYYTASTMQILVFDYYELAGGGFAFRYIGQTSSGSTALSTGLQWSVVAKEDGSGFEYLFAIGNYVSTFAYDDGNGYVNPSLQLNTTTITDTSNMVIMCKVYNGYDNFVDVRARNLIATQSVAGNLLYTFTLGGKTYMAALGGTTGAQKGGIIALEI